MKVLQVIPDFGLAGAEKMCMNLCLGLKRLGAEVSVISLYDLHSSITEELETNNIKIYYLNKKEGFDFSAIRKIKKIVKDEKPDVIHSHRYAVLYSMLATLFKRKIVKIHTIHNVAEKETTRFGLLTNKFFVKLFGLKLVALTPEIQKSISEFYKISKSKVPIVFNGIDLEKATPKKDYSIGETIKILHIGRFVEQKNHFFMVECFSKIVDVLPNIKVTFIGAGHLFNEVSSLIHEKGLDKNLFLIGERDDIYQQLHDHDIFILPSKYEGMPITLIEAMSVAVPIITTNVGGISDILDNGEDALVIDVSQEAFCDSIIRLSADKSLREHLGKNALIKSKRFSIGQMAQEYMSIYLEKNN